MPPVLGPTSPSPTRLKSWAGGRARTVTPSVMQKTGPRGRRGLLDEDLAAGVGETGLGVGAGGQVVGDDDALAGGETVGLDDVGGAEGVEGVVDLLDVVQTWAIAVGTPAAAMTSLAKALLPSSAAAAAEGPKRGCPRRARRRRPRRRGGPPGRRRRGRRGAVREGHDGGGVGGSASGSPRARASMPGLPGAAMTARPRRRREGPDQGVLTGARAEDQDHHAEHGNHPRPGLPGPNAAVGSRRGGPRSVAGQGKPRRGARCSREAGGTITREHRASRAAPLGGGPAATGAVPIATDAANNGKRAVGSKEPVVGSTVSGGIPPTRALRGRESGQRER